MNKSTPNLSPTFISTVSGVHDTYDIPDMNESGIFDADHVLGFLGSMSNFNGIDNPLTLYQFVPKDKKFEEENGLIKQIPPEQIDPYFEHILRDVNLIRLDTDKQHRVEDCCTVFREKCSDALRRCRLSDSRVALLYDKNNRSLCTDKDKLQSRINDYNRIKQEGVKILEFSPNGENRLYLKYRCGISNLDEYLFPVLYQNKLMAVLIMGRIPHPDFLRETDLSFHCCPENRKDILPHIREKEPLDAEDIENKIREVFKNIDKLEKRIGNAIEHAKQKKINESFTEIKTTFQRQSILINLNKEDALKEIGKLASEALGEVCHQFPDNEFIRIFAATNLNKPTLLSQFAFSDPEEIEGFRFDIEPWWYKINESDEEEKEKKVHRLIQLKGKKRRELINAFNSKSEIREKDALRILPTTSPKVSFIIWKRYNEGEMGQNENTRDIYRNALIDLYILIAQAYASIVGYVNEKGMENSIRIAGHEAGQIIPRVLQCLDKVLRKSSNALVRDITEGRFFWDIEDIYNQVTLTHNIYEKSRFVFKDIELKERENKRLSEILVKMAKIFRPLARHKHKSIPEPGVMGKKIEIKVEEHYFEHILYNLLDNAVKYAHEGSYIYMDVEEKDTNLIVSVTSYGKEIEGGDKIYDLYFRIDALKSQEEGLGIGMFVARKVAEAHGFQLTHTTERLSPKHLPALFFNADSYRGHFDNTKKELFPEVVALSKEMQQPLFRPGKIETEALIDMETFRNKFSITIPHQYFLYI